MPLSLVMFYWPHQIFRNRHMSGSPSHRLAWNKAVTYGWRFAARTMEVHPRINMPIMDCRERNCGRRIIDVFQHSGREPYMCGILRKRLCKVPSIHIWISQVESSILFHKLVSTYPISFPITFPANQRLPSLLLLAAYLCTLVAAVFSLGSIRGLMTLNFRFSLCVYVSLHVYCMLGSVTLTLPISSLECAFCSSTKNQSKFPFTLGR